MKKNRILSHRGKKNLQDLGNNYLSFQEAIKSGYGLETDIRDFNGRLYISHDIALKTPDLSFESFLNLIINNRCSSPIALNIKTSGSTNLLNEYRENLELINYFFFDMAIPDHLTFTKSKFINAIRVSEFEIITEEMIKNLSPKWIWYDSLLGEQDEVWVESLKDLIKYDLNICIVSSELHGANPYKLWEKLKLNFDFSNQNLYICTDLPDKVFNFFN